VSRRLVAVTSSLAVLSIAVAGIGVVALRDRDPTASSTVRLDPAFANPDHKISSAEEARQQALWIAEHTFGARQADLQSAHVYRVSVQDALTFTSADARLASITSLLSPLPKPAILYVTIVAANGDAFAPQSRPLFAEPPKGSDRLVVVSERDGDFGVNAPVGSKQIGDLLTKFDERFDAVI
jgi:hypothetical protein